MSGLNLKHLDNNYKTRIQRDREGPPGHRRRPRGGRPPSGTAPGAPAPPSGGPRQAFSAADVQKKKEE